MSIHKIHNLESISYGGKISFFRAKNLSVNTWRSGPDICSLICGRSISTAGYFSYFYTFHYLWILFLGKPNSFLLSFSILFAPNSYWAAWFGHFINLQNCKGQLNDVVIIVDWLYYSNVYLHQKKIHLILLRNCNPHLETDCNLQG